MKKKYLNAIGQYFFYALLVVSVVLTVIYFIKSGNINPNDTEAKQMSDLGSILDTYFYWAYILIALAVLFAVGLPLINIVSNPKKGLKSLAAVAVFAALFIVAYQFADGTILDIPGYKGSDNVPSMLKFTDMIIFSVYAMVAASLVAVIYAEISKLFK